MLARIRLGQLLFYVCLFICGCNQQSDEKWVCRTIGDHDFRFPQDLVVYSDEEQHKAASSGVFDIDQGIVLKLSEVSSVDSPGSIGEILGVTSASTGLDAARTVPEVFLAMWFGEGEYLNRYVLFDESAGLYRIHIAKDIESMWEYFRDDPTSYAGDVPDYESQWIASCSNVRRPLKGAADGDICKSSYVVDGVRIEFYSTSSALSELESIHSQLTERVWRYKAATACN